MSGNNPHRAWVPAAVDVPTVHGAIVKISLVVDSMRVVAPGLDELRPVLLDGADLVVEKYCQLWTLWLANEYAALAGTSPS